MALNTADRIALLVVIRPRVRAVVLNYALYILGEPTNTPNHANRVTWAKATVVAADSAVHQLINHMLNEPNFVSVGSDVTDAQITGHIETAINTHYIAT